MIDTEEGFRSALERAMGFLETPPAPGSQDEREFAALLDELEAYRPPMPTSEPASARTPEHAEAASLSARATALLSAQTSGDAAKRFSTFPRDGRGIGPTTGI